MNTSTLRGFPATLIGVGTDVRVAEQRKHENVQSSYAVTWREPARPVYSGKLELGANHLRFEGAAPPGRLLDQKLLYRDLRSVRVAREPNSVGGGRPALVLERRHGHPIHIASVTGPGMLTEMAAHLRPRFSTKTV